MNQFVEAFESLLLKLGEDPKREDLIKTPARISKMYSSFLTGYEYKNPLEILANPIKAPLSEHNEIILVDNIFFCSLCEHHLVPFFGQVHLAYIPNKYIIGLSRIPKFISTLSRRLQIQERLTIQIVEGLTEVLKPKAIMIKMSASHACLAIEEQSIHNTKLTTLAFRGDPEMRSFLSNQLNHYG